MERVFNSRRKRSKPGLFSGLVVCEIVPSSVQREPLMDSDTALIAIANDYFRACLGRDFDAMLDALYPGDLDKLKNNVVWCAQAMAQIEPDRRFLELFGGGLEPEDLRVLSPRSFFRRMLEASMGEADGGDWQDIASTFRLCSVERTSENRAVVGYTFEVAFDDLPETVEKEMELQFIGDRWYVMLQPGVRRLPEVVRPRLEDFLRRKDRDRPSTDPEFDSEELEAFGLWGYRDDEGRIVIEPRFAAAGKFAEGLAPVRVFKKWGYINADGVLVIPALYDAAKPFSEGLAAVAVEDDEGETVWGYIDSDGGARIEPRFATAGVFRHGVAKVSVGTEDEKRSFFIDRSGNEQASKFSRN